MKNRFHHTSLSRFILLIIVAISTNLVVNAFFVELDPSFGNGAGKNITSFGGISDDLASDIAIQSDGRIVTVGSRNNNNDVNTAIVRYRADGTLDTSFNGTGIIISSFSSGYDEATAVAIQPDGKIVVGGYAVSVGTTNSDFMLLRYNLNGTLDTSFGIEGVVLTEFVNNSNDHIADIVIQPDGKIVAVGSTQPTSGWNEMAFARYNPNGSLDIGFGNNGKIVTQFGVGDDYATEVALQSDAKIVIIGRYSSTVTNRIAILRFNPDGTPDTTLDNDGILLFNSIPPDLIFGMSLIVQPDNKMIAAVTFRNNNNNQDFALIRLNVDGTADQTFGSDGVVITQVGNFNDELGDALLLPDGKILVGGGSISPPSNKNFSLVKYNADGSLDTSFGTGGKVFTNITGIADVIYKMALQSDGQVAVVGVSVGSSSGRDFTVARYKPDGKLDNKFGEVGLVHTSPRNRADEANDIALQADGKIIAAGSSQNANSMLDCAIARYNSDGTIDASFGAQGRVTISLNSLNDGINAIAIQPDGKIVATGYSGNSPEADLVVLRFNQDGSLDSTFSDDGKIILPLSTSADVGEDILVQPDGKIVVAGYSFTSSISNFTVLRFNPDGSMDNTFDTDGIAMTTINGWGALARAMVRQPDGKIVLAGSYIGPNPRDFAVVRFNSDGSLDSSFGSGGKVTTPIGNSSDEAYGIALQPSGKLVVAGFSASATVEDFSIVRYNTDGSLDSTFNGDGKILTPINGNSIDEATSVISQPYGKIIVAGISIDSTNSNRNFTLVRYNLDGSLDSSFGTGGKLITDYGNLGESTKSMVLQSDGKIILAGSINKNSVREFALVRYLNSSTSPFDFDGDGKSDLSLFRPENGVWYLLNSTTGFAAAQFGVSTDKIVPADYDGDGKTDLAVYRSGTWYLQRSLQGFTGISFGDSNDVPQPADFDGDGRAELVVWRPSNGVWYVYNLATNSFTAAQFGASTDKPVASDYDGDGKADYAVFRPSNGTWYLQRSTAGFTGVQFGDSQDKPIPADYDGDGKTDVAVYRPSNGVWYLNRSTAGFTGIQFGMTTDLPVAADYDGDGKSDIAVFREGIWYLQQSSNGFTGIQFGTSTDKPSPNAFVY